MNYNESILTQIRIRPNDLDSLGHVNNSIVLEYFELGRWDWMDHFHLQQGAQIVPVVARIEVKYRKEIKPGFVKLVTTLEPCDPSFSYQANFEQILFQDLKGKETPVVQGRVKVAFLDATERTLSSLQSFLDDTAAHITRESANEIA